MTLQKPIIFFDGDCKMCNTFVNLVLRIDRKELFHFAPLQGATAREILPPQDSDPQKWSMLYVDESGIHDQSDASLAVYRRLGFPWSILALFRLIPSSIRNPAYRMIARNRYRWFGKRKVCRVPTAAERSRFLP